MSLDKESQGDLKPAAPAACESVIPKPKLKLLDQVREVMRFHPYSLRTEKAFQQRVTGIFLSSIFLP